MGFGREVMTPNLEPQYLMSECPALKEEPLECPNEPSLPQKALGDHFVVLNLST